MNDFKWISVLERYPTDEENREHLVVIEADNPIMTHYGNLTKSPNKKNPVISFSCFNCEDDDLGGCELKCKPQRISHWILLPKI